jgi:hypothetical protein
LTRFQYFFLCRLSIEDIASSRHLRWWPSQEKSTLLPAAAHTDDADSAPVAVRVVVQASSFVQAAMAAEGTAIPSEHGRIVGNGHEPGPVSSGITGGWRRISLVVGEGGRLLCFAHSPADLAAPNLTYVAVL